MSLARRLDRLEPIADAASGSMEASVYGIVDRADMVDGVVVNNVIRKWKGTIGNMQPTDEEPNILIAEKLEPLILKHKKWKGAIGGRAGTKSIMAMDVMVGEVSSCGSKVFCLRERMTSLRESIFEGIRDRIQDQSQGGFLAVPTSWEIRHKSRGKFKFGGLQNIIDMKGSFKYKIFLLEEAAKTSQRCLDTLGPTLRGVDGAELWLLWNPESSTDPMSQEFIVPYQADFDRQGYYEDDHHLLIWIGFEDNPWFHLDSSLVQEYEKDCAKVEDGRMAKSRFNHIWHGAFSDDIEDSIIMPDWFDACVDAHKKLGFEPTGSRVVGHDPSDVGNDAKGYAARHGVVFTDIQEIEAPNANRAFDVACTMARKCDADAFGWDCDGMGALLRDQAERNFQSTKMHTFMYKGSESPNRPEQVFKASENYNMKGSKKNKDVFKNKRGQNSISFAERCRRTYEAVVLGKYHDPDTLVSFCSEGITPQAMAKLRAECCKMPVKPGDKICLYSKEEMRKGIMQSDGSRIKIPSPNLFDSCVLSFDDGHLINTMVQNRSHRPRPRPVMGIR